MKQALLVTVGLLCFGFLLPGIMRGVIYENKQQIKSEERPDEVKETFIDLHVSPNPTNDFFHLSKDVLVEEIRIYNTLGKQVRSFSASPGAEYPIHDLPDGLYMVSLLHGELGTFKTLRLSKAQLRP